jgi:hypothetical protein
MPWAAGVFTRVRNWVTDKGGTINPQAAIFDQEDDNFAAGLNNCITKDGLNKPSATMDFNSQRLTALGDATGATDALNRQTADARYALVIPKRKAADTARASTTVLADDPDLIAALLANSFYGFDLYLKVNPSTGGLKCGMAYSGTFTSAPSFFAGHALLNAATVSSAGNNVIGGGSIFGSVGGSSDWYRIFGTIATTGAGNLSLQWAQGSSNVASATIQSGSFMIVTKLG